MTVVDSRPFVGTCQLRGDRKKVLVGGADLVDWNRRMQGHGVSADSLTIDWPELMRFKRTFTNLAPEQNEPSFVEAGIGTVHGRARFVDRTSLQVGGETLVGRHVVIAGGAWHATLNISGEEHLTTSTQFLELEPAAATDPIRRGWLLAFEFAHVAARAGTQCRVDVNHSTFQLQRIPRDGRALRTEFPRLGSSRVSYWQSHGPLMAALAIDTEGDSAAIQRMLDDGAPSDVPPRLRRTRGSPVWLPDEPSAEERAAQRRAARRVYRLYCVACGRSSEVSIPPARPGRCTHCAGTMIVELAPD